MQVLVTGGAGFIGSHTVDTLIKEGHRVTILDSLEKTAHPKGKPDCVPQEVEFIEGDVRNRSDLGKVHDLLTGMILFMLALVNK
jgi:dTDP-L-rhamnose 4-epimerase